MKNTKLNFLFIMDDQHRSEYLGFYGKVPVNTPNLDRLSSRGTVFTNCFTNSPLCVPARAGLASGLLPDRLGCLDNHYFLPASVKTYYQRLRDYGYRVGCAGKLDLAKPDHYNGITGDRPCVFTAGFTHPVECEGKMHAGSSLLPIGPYTNYLKEKNLLEKFYHDYRKRESKGWIKEASQDSVLDTEDFEDSYIGRRAAEWINNIPDDFPWHLLVSFAGPHDPFDPPKEYSQKYMNVKMPPALAPKSSGKPEWIQKFSQKTSAAETEQIRRQYCAAIELIDFQIGMILESLEIRGMQDNTYIIFTSDHGEMLGDHGLFTKHVPYEASIRVPLIISSPNVKKQKSDALIELSDLNPALCELAGLPPQENIDAESFVQILTGAEIKHRETVVTSLRPFHAVRSHEYKYIKSFNGFIELYNLKNDPAEFYNLADQEKNLCLEMEKIYKQRLLGCKWQY
ncbi:MAG TPA: hypothetical protein DC049_10110 [Spirochaetia bacterium]|nr:hypothetical protein [Spirochaetia bacterium]